MSVRTIASDYAFGVSNEEDALASIRKFDATLQRSTNKFSPFDYLNESNTVFVELKTRTNARDKYPTTMLPFSKVKIAEKNPMNAYYFVFKYTDGIYYIKYDKDRFASYEVRQGGRFDRGCPELNQYIYIPVTDLVQL